MITSTTSTEYYKLHSKLIMALSYGFSRKIIENIFSNNIYK